MLESVLSQVPKGEAPGAPTFSGRIYFPWHRGHLPHSPLVSSDLDQQAIPKHEPKLRVIEYSISSGSH